MCQRRYIDTRSAHLHAKLAVMDERLNLDLIFFLVVARRILQGSLWAKTQRLDLLPSESMTSRVRLAKGEPILANLDIRGAKAGDVRRHGAKEFVLRARRAEYSEMGFSCNYTALALLTASSALGKSTKPHSITPLRS